MRAVLLPILIVSSSLFLGCSHSARLRERCVGGALKACAALLEETPDDDSRSAELAVLDASLNGACQDTSIRACIQRGRLWTYLGPLETLPWEQLAADYGRACDHESSEGCFLLAELHESGLVEAENEAPGLYERACQFGDETACARSASLKRFAQVQASEMADTAPRPRTGAGVGTAGGLEKQAIQSVLRAVHGQLQTCYERELARRPDLGGILRLDFTVHPSGLVSQVTPGDSSLASPGVIACALERARRFRFPEETKGIATSFQFPWIFKSAGND